MKTSKFAILLVLFLVFCLCFANEVAQSFSDDSAENLWDENADEEVTVQQASPSVLSTTQQKPQQEDSKPRFINEFTYAAVAIGIIALVVLVCLVTACWPTPVSEEEIAEANSKPKRKLTVDEVIEYLGYGKFQWIFLFFCAVINFAGAGEIMVASFLMPELRASWGLEAWQAALVGVMIFLGELGGSVVFGFLGDKLGRKLTCFVSMLMIAVFGFASAFSPNVYVLIVFRFLVGFGIGGDIVPIALFTEFLPVASRGGALLNIQTVWCCGGIFSALLAIIFLPKEASRMAVFGADGWRYMLVVIAIMFLLILPFIAIIPESPRYLMVCNKVKEAQSTLERVAYYNEKVVDFELVHSHEEKAEELAEQKAKVTDLLCSKKYFLLTLVTALLWALGAFCYYGISFLTPVFFAVHGNGMYDVYVSSLVVSFAELPSQFIGNCTINSIGRKLTYFFFFLFGAAGTLLLLAPLPYVLLTVIACVARGGINGVTSMNWVYTPEVYSTSLRTSAMGFHSALGRLTSSLTPWITNFLVSKKNALPAILLFGIVQVVGTIVSCCIPIDPVGMKLQDFHHHQDDQFSVPSEKKSEAELRDMKEPLMADAPIQPSAESTPQAQ